MIITRTKGPDGATAMLSPDGIYRYHLTRVLHPQHRFRKTLGVIMLNPSKADAFTDDRTIKKVMHYANEWGYNHVSVANLFAYRTTYPSELRVLTEEQRVGPENYYWLNHVLSEAHDKILCGWGANKLVTNQVYALVKMYSEDLAHSNLKELVTLETTNKGMPMHLLYKRNDLQPFHWRPPA